MNEETKSQLDEIMKKHAQKQEEDKKIEEEQQKEKDDFLEQFKRQRQEIIRPAMEEIGNHLQTYGCQYRIVEEDASTDSQGRTKFVNISMHIFPSKEGENNFSRSRHDYPEICFSGDSGKKRIFVSASTMMPGSSKGGWKGGFGDFGIDETNRSRIEERITALIKEVF